MSFFHDILYQNVNNNIFIHKNLFDKTLLELPLIVLFDKKI